MLDRNTWCVCVCVRARESMLGEQLSNDAIYCLATQRAPNSVKKRTMQMKKRNVVRKTKKRTNTLFWRKVGSTGNVRKHKEWNLVKPKFHGAEISWDQQLSFQRHKRPLLGDFNARTRRTSGA